MFKRRCLLLFAAYVLLASGCPDRTERAKVLPPIDPGDQIPGASSVLTVDIYLDVTLSMRGFIVTGISSNYEQMLQFLERAAQRGWDTGRVTFYRFGSRIESVVGR